MDGPPPIGFDNIADPGKQKHVTQIAYRPVQDNLDKYSSVSPAPPPPEPELYPPGPPQSMYPPPPPSEQSPLYPQVPAANDTQAGPIGFEMSNIEQQGGEKLEDIENNGGINQDNGPTDVKVPLETKGEELRPDEYSKLLHTKQFETEAYLLDPNDPSSGVRVRAGSVDPKDEETMFFSDGERKIDYILAFEPDATKSHENRKKKRDYFEEELQKEGLQLEYEPVEKSKSGKVAFVKVHAPWDVLAKGAELMNMKMPLAPNDMGFDEGGLFDCIPTPFEIDPDLMEEDDNYFTAPFNRARMDQYVIKTKESFFTNAQRSRIVHSILSRSFYEDADPENPSKRRFGIKKLIANSAYSAAYPLHDGKFSSEHSILTTGKLNDRHLLYEIWARPGTWYKYQPLDKIRNYFGEKVGIYFAWLGFYTMMLIPASIVGVVAFIYGIATLFDDVVSNDICDVTKAGNLTMCPLCDGRCTYWKLVESCSYSRATYLFDNPATVAFACFMALWASFFHEVWKRKQAEIEYDWDVADFEQEEETVRPEFEARVRRRKENPINRKLEPYVPNWSKCMRYFTSVSIIVFFLLIVMGAVFCVILYRIIMAAIFAASKDDLIKGRASLVASGTAACINLVVIIILNFIYQRIAQALTEIENHRTESEWEDAFTFKMYLFQFVNYYASIMYIAFFKGRFTGRPGNYDRNLLDHRQEECDPAGCLIELCLQLGIIMVGKQIIANFKEIILPKLMVWFKSRSAQQDKEHKVYAHWEQDYNLADQPRLGLFDEYLEMVIQYGFVTVFVAAFPLAPLFALINNVIEIRLDAYKFVTQWKRPMAVRAQDIGIWFGILQGISAIAVVSNAAIIAFTSEFIPRMVYKYGYSDDSSMDDYFQNFSMSLFRTADFEEKSVPEDMNPDIGPVTECWYRDFRNPPGTADQYKYTMQFWHVFAARLAFVVVFENLIVFMTWLVMYLIPDMPYKVKMQMLREKYLSKQALFHAEEVKASTLKYLEEQNAQL